MIFTHFLGLSRAQLIRAVIHDLNIQLPSFEQTTEQQTTGNADNNDISMKKSNVPTIISQLISKHTTPNLNQSGTIESELLSFKDIMESDALKFWKKNKEKYPNLATVANIVLQIPITNAKSEAAFSIAGCLIREKRASIEPLRAEKVLFVHDNYNLIQF